MSTLSFDLYWSMRSPYCYVALDRVLDIHRTYDVDIAVRIVYPIAIRDPGFFARVPNHYRPYHLLDAQRVAAFHGIPYRRPIPDPIVQNLETNEIADDQPFIRRLTRLAAAAAQQGNGLRFLDHVMRLIWDGRTEGWDQGTRLADSIAEADLDADALMRDVAVHPETLEDAIEANQQAHSKAGHPGVPLFVFDEEPFFGQDRIDILLWRMKEYGLTKRG